MENNDTKICLVVIYNHRYDKNILRIEELYKGKFSHIFHVMPFYDGDKKNVIPVYESSFYFSNYIAYAYQYLKNKGFTHFFVVADDMILNPVINENSFFETIGLAKDACFINYFFELKEADTRWLYKYNILNFRTKKDGVEFEKELPTLKEAKESFKKFGIEQLVVTKKYYWRKIFEVIFSHSFKGKVINLKLLKAAKRLEYPLVGGYSDLLIIPDKTMKKFAHYCGVFAAAELFTEIAIPTALVLSAEKISTIGGGFFLRDSDKKNCFDKNIKLNEHGVFSCDEIKEIGAKYQNSLSELLKNYPPKRFFIHPIKLSIWK